MVLRRPADIPQGPGVYEFLDATGRVLYVGKARNLARRVGDYFQGDLHPRTARMVANADAIRWVLCASEQEALLLEREWIHAKQPPYNVRLRAGSGYRGVAITEEAVPRLRLWRGERPPGAESFGPYPGVAADDLLDALVLLFGVRSCDAKTYREAERRGRACLLGETGTCLAPCVGSVGVDEHRAAAGALRAYLRRPGPELGERLEREMRELAATERFEAAARRRDQLAALEVLGRRQRVVTATGADLEVLAVVRRDGRIGVARSIVAGGVLSGVETYVSVDDPALDDAEVLAAAAGQLAPQEGFTRISSHPVDGVRRVRGAVERGLLNLTHAQAEEALSAPARTDAVDPADAADHLGRLAALLGAGRPIDRIEATDISHTGGRETVASVVVLDRGVPRPEQYRRLNLGDGGGDDYAAMRELVRRRFSGREMGLGSRPDLLLIDGGPGQVAAAIEGLRRAGLAPDGGGDGEEGLGEGPLVVGIAKRFEELWPAGAERAIVLAPADPVLLMLMRARDEAHRHARAGHRRSRSKTTLRLRLDEVRGLGAKRRAALLSHFGTFAALAAAPEEEIAQVPGIGSVLAGRILAALRD